MVIPVEGFEPTPTPAPPPPPVPSEPPPPPPEEEDDIVGQLQSDRDLREAIDALNIKGKGKVRNLIAELGRAVAAQDYVRAGDILEHIQNKYGDPFEDTVEDVLEANVSSEVFEQIEKPEDEPTPTPVPSG
jgi:hypothetical protein